MPFLDIRNASLRAALPFALALFAGTPSEAQQPDSARAGVPAAQPSRRPAAPNDTIAGPPISPRRAFLSSLIVPGAGQAALDRPMAGSLFVAIETLSLVMIQKSRKELEFAKRVGGIGVQCPDAPEGQLCLDAGAPVGSPPTYPRATTPNRFSGGRLSARRQHVEDWFALLFANHLLAGADAYVAAHLWDLPARVSVRPTERGHVALSATLAW